MTPAEILAALGGADLLLQGGPAMVAIFLATLGVWTLLIERWIFLTRVFPSRARCRVETWRGRAERSSRRARWIHRALLSEAHAELDEGIPPARALVTLLPLLGLLGTVLGMMEVFDVLAVTGRGDPRALAGGISRATVTTLTGLLSALAAVPALRLVERAAAQRRRELATRLEDA